MTTLLEPRISLAYMAYLGYAHSSPNPVSLLPTTSALTVTRPRAQDRKKGTVSRSVFRAFVVGAKGSGKTSLLRAFVGKEWKSAASTGGTESEGAVKTVVNSVEINGEEKYLVVSGSPLVSGGQTRALIDSTFCSAARVWAQPFQQDALFSGPQTRRPRFGLRLGGYQFLLICVQSPGEFN